MPPRDHVPRSERLSWFRRHKGSRRRVAAVRLDLEGESAGTALGRVSNRIAIGLLALVMTGLLIWGVRSADWKGGIEWIQSLKQGKTDQPAPADPADLPLVEEVPLLQPKGETSALASLYLALSASKIGRHEEARQLLEDARRTDPQLVGWHHVSGLVAWARRDLTAAREALRTSVAAGEGVAVSLVRLGDIALELGDIQEAIFCYRRVVELYPRDPWIRFKLGISLRRAGALSEGLEHMRQAVQLRPQDGNMRAWERLAAWDEAGRPPEGPQRVPGLPAFVHMVNAVVAAHRSDMESAAAALKEFTLESDAALRDLAAMDPLVMALARHERLRPMVPVFSAAGSSTVAP